MKRELSLLILNVTAMILLFSACSSPKSTYPGETSQLIDGKTENTLSLESDSESIVTPIEVDIDGDGVQEQVDVILRTHHVTDNSGEDTPQHSSSLRTTVGGVLQELPLGDFKPYDASLYSFKLDNANKECLIIAFDEGGSGMGRILLYAVQYSDKFITLPLPKFYEDNSHERLGGSYGLQAEAILVNDFSVDVRCAETGFLGNVELDVNRLSDGIKGQYDENGIPKNNVFMTVDGICSVNIKNETGIDYVEIAQYVYGAAASDGLGFFTSYLHWEDGNYVISNQKCIPFYN